MHTDGEIVFQGTFENLLTRVESLMLTPSAVKRHLSSLLSSPSEKLKNSLDAIYFTCETSFLLTALDRDELAPPVTCRFQRRTANVDVYLAESNERLAFLVTTQAKPIL